MEGVLGIRQSHFWQHSSDTMIGNIHVQALPDASEQKIIQEVCASVLTIGYKGPVFRSQIKMFIGHTNENNIHDKINCRLNIRNMCYHSPQSFLVPTPFCKQ
jgi:hypothetical protein